MARTRKQREKTRSKRKMNSFMKKQMQAKKKGLESFVYKGKTYKRHTKGHLVFYKGV